MRSRFTDGKNFFKVKEVIQTPVGLTVYYYNEDTKQDYSCLLEAFSERFSEVEDTDNTVPVDPTSTNKKQWIDSNKCCG